MTFVERSKLKKTELVAPASYFDGESFPKDATAVQFVDFSEYASTMPKFWETESAVTFETMRLKPFAKDLARLIRAAPEYDDSFPLVEAPEPAVAGEPTIGRPADV